MLGELLNEISVTQQRCVYSKTFPLILTSSAESNRLEDFCTILATHRSELDQLLKQHKAIIFRNCGLKNAEDFHQVIESTGLQEMAYVGGGDDAINDALLI